jgi:hypothetical protein
MQARSIWLLRIWVYTPWHNIGSVYKLSADGPPRRGRCERWTGSPGQRRIGSTGGSARGNGWCALGGGAEFEVLTYACCRSL